MLIASNKINHPQKLKTCTTLPGYTYSAKLGNFVTIFTTVNVHTPSLFQVHPVLIILFAGCGKMR